MKLKFLASTVLALGVYGSASAGTSSGVLTVTANVVPVCAVGSALVTFPTYSYSTDTTAQTAVNVSCIGISGNLTFTLGNGLNYSGGSRRVSNGGTPPTFINYHLMSTAAGADLASTDAVGVVVDPGTGSGSAIVYSKLPQGQGNKPAGVYTDTVVITLSY